MNAARFIYSHTGLRGIAAMCVFIGHIYDWCGAEWHLEKRYFGFFSWGTYAVDLFFILSGFILNWVYYSDSKAINWGGYLQARVGRILPLYYLSTAACLPVFIFSLVKYGTSYVGKDYLMTLLLNALMISGVVGGHHITMNEPAWSISVEFFCYLLVFPPLMYVYRLLGTRRNLFLICLLLVGTLTLLLGESYSFQPVSISHWLWESSWLARGVFGFSIGFILCAAYRKSSDRPANRITINLVVLVSFAFFVLTRLGYLQPGKVIYIFPFLVYFTAFDTGISADILKWLPLQWLGDRSYSIYLWHIPVIKYFLPISRWIMPRVFGASYVTGLINCLALVAAVLLISDISYRYFEAPCRRFIRGIGRP